MTIRAMGKVRGLNIDQYEQPGDEEVQTVLSGQAEQLAAFATTQYQENVRNGRAFWVANAIGSPVAPVTSIPTTAHTIALYNNEPDGGRSYVIDYVWAFNVAVSSVTIFHTGMIGCLGQVREAIPANAAPVIKSANGTGKLDTRARTFIGGTALPATTGLAANWFPIGDSWINSVVTLPGHSKIVDIDGRVIVSPGRWFAVHTLSSITTQTYIMGIGWTEKNLYLG
jgi:hypothetical protein